ncbi:MAG: VIT domain-containing protein, partial [Planctomycetota bacterium]
MDSGRVARLLSWGLVLLSLAVLPACRIVTESSGPRELRLRPPALLVRLDPTLPSRGLALHSLVADVEIIGPIATTTLELVYENPHERDLEGRFVLPLPPGASPCRFAMEVGGELREGVVVERERGRVIFEKIVRREVDPGLLEWVQGNAFQARVFPIPALGTKRLIVAYEEELTPLAGGGASCTLPLGYGEVTDRVEISARIAGVPGWLSTAVASAGGSSPAPRNRRCCSSARGPCASTRTSPCASPLRRRARRPSSRSRRGRRAPASSPSFPFAACPTNAPFPSASCSSGTPR